MYILIYLYFFLYFRFFIETIRKSKKEVLRCMLRTIERDCRSNTGRNIRRLRMERTDENGKEVDKAYASIPTGQEWKIPFAKELVDIKARNLVVHSFTREELDDITEHVCCV